MFVLSTFVLNVFVGLSEVNTVGNLHSILRTEADVSAGNREITGNMYSFFDKYVHQYISVLKDYTTIYTVYECSNKSIRQVSQGYGSSNLNIKLKENQILEITIKQNTISQLQKLNNMFNGRNDSGSIIVSEKRAVN